MRNVHSEFGSNADDVGSSRDLVTYEIIKGKVIAVADEMGIVLAKSSMSPVIYEVLDFACGICDSEGQLVAQTNGITVFTGTFSGQVKTVIKKYAQKINPGDVFMLNNPYEGGTHLCDICVINPIFVEERLIGFAVAIAHWSEIGGMSAGSLPPGATEIFQEGVRFPALKLFSSGVKQEEIFEIIAANSRLPKMSTGDLNAQLAAVRIAEVRLKEMAGKYGHEMLKRAFDHVLDTSEKLSIAALNRMPKGVYTATDWIDGDGISDSRFPVQVSVEIGSTSVKVDFTGSSKQLRGPVNCSAGAMISAVKTVFKAMVEPFAPSNDGWFRPLEVVCPPGTVFSAESPAPVGWFFEGAGHVSELVWKALAPVLSDRCSAGSANSLCVTVLAGKSQNHEPFVLVEPNMVGWGGTSQQDGASVVSAITNGDTFNYSIELLESKFPLRVNRYALNIGNGVGAGTNRGGFGVVREYEILCDRAELSASFGRSIQRPWGLEGGREGSCNYVEVERAGETIRGARLPTLDLSAGDKVTLVTGGGGGFGNPLKRPIGMVKEDVSNGYISIVQAEADYGVMIMQNGEVDVAATDRLRSLGAV